MIYNVFVEFSEWINRKYVEKRGNTRLTIEDFAKFIGISQSLMSLWMKSGSQMPKARNLSKLAARYPDVYKDLGLTPPSQEDQVDYAPPELVRRLNRARAEARRQLTSRGITFNSPEGLRMIEEIFSKYGFTNMTIENDEPSDSL